MGNKGRKYFHFRLYCRVKCILRFTFVIVENSIKPIDKKTNQKKWIKFCICIISVILLCKKGKNKNKLTKKSEIGHKSVILHNLTKAEYYSYIGNCISYWAKPLAIGLNNKKKQIERLVKTFGSVDTLNCNEVQYPADGATRSRLQLLAFKLL